jgi:hypothetical protein
VALGPGTRVGAYEILTLLGGRAVWVMDAKRT